jgi:hypothetical protein
MAKAPKIRGIVTWTVSPYEQKVFGDWLDARFVMTKLQRKISENWEWIPSFVFTVGLISWANAENKREHERHRY